ncbi:uncharacterized protein KD926_005142 [Aspergillus affinis]|uniref:uncharacterized protein n=1 Tax=Aspergillus affinis TaxID=1070780 RepID=UPI0022FDB2CC|nr:uncharacterized protein KD926_005142 [Aspergillus affinis]KAI9042812.1 hypothetical protein KD926_005142 [Aspergillus affinis]
MSNNQRLKRQKANKPKLGLLETMTDFVTFEIGAMNPAFVKRKNSKTPMTDLLNMPLEELLDQADLDPDVQDTIIQEIKQHGAERFHFCQRIVDCPDGRLFKFIGDFDNDDLFENLPTCMATITFRLPSTFWDMVSFNQNKNLFNADRLVIEVVRDGQLNSRDVSIREHEILVELYLDHPVRYHFIDTVSVYLAKGGQVVKPIVSLYNTTKVHLMNMLVNFHNPVIKLIFEMDAGVNPESLKQVLWEIRRTIIWRLSTGNWYEKYPLIVGAWSYFQVSLQPMQRNFHAVFHALDIALMPLLALPPEAHPNITKFPFTLERPYRLPNCPQFEGPLTIERLNRGPVIRP